MSATLCRVDGCYEAAIGIGYWTGRRGDENPHPRPANDTCRVHYLEQAADRLVEADVIGPAGIVDCRTQDTVYQGNAVTLDPVETHLASLVAGGLIKVRSPKAAAPAAKPKG